jgi:hypothetical protein
MGVKILTIPVEDFVYGLELMMMVVFFYEMFLLRFRVARREATPFIIEKI